ncbi:MAG: glycerophosphodiester phosphodiesterase, partial [Epulopiscium sp.]|nr:glycerophosphodiester phosphodiesterase [Candidatus Epulonipiscium sp.]
MRKIKKRYLILIILVSFIMFVWLNNTSLFMDQSGSYKLLAHRGLAQTFDISQVEWDTNTAEIIYEPEHKYLENTIESMDVAFSYGADVVELDIQRTKDGQLAVFHDYDLSMRTDGKGKISEYTMEELKQLDIGYGYTADNGESYPFRGQGIGMMPELKEALERFSDRELLIHIKDDGLETAKILWTYLASMPPERLAQITVYGDEQGLAYLREK